MNINSFIKPKLICGLLLGIALITPSIGQAVWFSCGEIVNKAFGGVDNGTNIKLPGAGPYYPPTVRNISWGINPMRFSGYVVPVYMSKSMVAAVPIVNGKQILQCKGTVISSYRVDSTSFYIYGTSTYKTCNPGGSATDPGFNCSY